MCRRMHVELSRRKDVSALLSILLDQSPSQTDRRSPTMWRLFNGVAEIGLHLPHAHLLDRSDDLVPSECVMQQVQQGRLASEE